MSDARENGDRGKEQTDEALSARLQRLNEGLGQIRQSGRPSESSEAERATTASGFAKGLQLTSELVAGVVVGVGLGGLIDHWLGTAPWGLVVFTLLGFATGVFNVMRSARIASARMSGDAQSQNKDG